MIRAAEQGPKQDSIQDWNIHLTFGYSVKFEVRKKGGGNQYVLQKCYSFAAVELEKILWSTAMADSAIDCKVIIVANRCVYRKNVSDQNASFFFLRLWLGKVHMETEPGFHDLWWHLTVEPPEFHSYLEPPTGQKCPM